MPRSGKLRRTYAHWWKYSAPAYRNSATALELVWACLQNAAAHEQRLRASRLRSRTTRGTPERAKYDARVAAAEGVNYHLMNWFNLTCNHPRQGLSVAQLRELVTELEDKARESECALALATKLDGPASLTTFSLRAQWRAWRNAARDVREFADRQEYAAWRFERPRRIYDGRGRLIQPRVGKRKRTVAQRKKDEPAFDGGFLS